MYEFGILLSLVLLIFVAYKGYSVIVFAPICAAVAAVISGYPLLPLYTELFMPNAANYFRNFFPIFILGAIFGKLIEETGMAKSIAETVAKFIGAQRALWAIVAASAVLTYGGVSLFVVAFAVYPVASSLCKQADIPKRLIPACIAFGAFTFTATFLPGTMQIQNIISTRYFGTTVYAAPVLGLIAGIILIVCGMLWLEYRRKQAQAKGEGYGTGHINEIEIDNTVKVPPFVLAILPLVAVLILNFIFTKWVLSWNPAEFADRFPTLSLQAVSATWALIMALIVGILLTIVFGWKRLGIKNTKKAINAGATGSLLAILNTASEVGYGNIIAQLPGFKSISGVITSIRVGGTPLVSLAIACAVLAGITGSGSGGLSIALEMLSGQYIEWANSINMNVELLHRIASMACTGLDTMPHNGAVITLLAITGLTHKESYPDICVCTVVLTTVITLIAATLLSLF